MNRTKNADGKAILSIMIVMSSFALCNTTSGVLINQIIDAYQIESASQGLVASIPNAGSMFALLAIPFLQGRTKKSVVLLIATVLEAVSMLVTGISPNYPILVVAYLVYGIGGGWVEAYTNSTIIDICQKNSVRYVNALHGVYGIGAILTPLLIQFLLRYIGWRQVYLAVAVVTTLIALQFAIISRRNKAMFVSSVDSEKKVDAAAVKNLFWDKQTLVLLFCTVFSVCGQAVIPFWVVRYMHVQFNAEALGSVALSLFWLTSTVSRFTAAHIRRDPLTLVLWGNILTTLIQFAGILCNGPAAILAMCALTGLTCGFITPMLIHVFVSRHPGKTSFPTTVLMVADKIAMVLLPILVARVAVVSMQFSMMLMAICSAAAILFAVLSIAFKPARAC